MSSTMPDECEFCDAQTTELRFHDRCAGIPPKWLCEVCLASGAEVAAHYPAQAGGELAIRVVVSCTWMVLREIRALRADLEKRR